MDYSNIYIVEAHSCFRKKNFYKGDLDGKPTFIDNSTELNSNSLRNSKS